jgi:drug/metabolite transporter (DMT)-like permease
MSTLTNDRPAMLRVPPRSRIGTGLVLAFVSAASFGMSGALARGLIDAGWSVGAIVLVRIGMAALIVTPFGLLALRGRWHLLRRNAGLVVFYGLVAVFGAQFAYFSAVQHMAVGPALLIEYTAPAAVVLWMWLRHGQRPGRLTLLGAAIAVLGLVLVLDLLSGGGLSLVGVAWALAAMVGCAAYFVVSGNDQTGLPPIVLAAAGLVIGTAATAVLAVLGALPMQMSTLDATYAGRTTAWWVPLVLLGVITAAIAYVTGIAAAQRLGSRLASFVALTEVVAGVLWAWVLLDQLPRGIQMLGGSLILLGVLAVKLGEKSVNTEEPVPA